MFNFSPTQYDVNFKFLNFRIRIHPFFWVLAALLFMHTRIDSLREWLLMMAAWVCAVFISVLVHELGHALVFRYIFSVESHIMLHGMGGVTIPFAPPRRYYGLKGVACKIFLYAAGCLSGFVLAAIAAGLLVAINVQQNEFSPLYIIKFFLWCTMFVSVVWGIFNLLPIYPFDGGQISREIFLFFSPRKGLANSLVISIVTAGICIWLCITRQMFFAAIIVGFFAYQNYIELTRQSFRY
ncbi:MAG: site-2 protease family protein [Planctomycetaceae bacterium]|jgi:Zn-dependent protease|nr:site-2 protease family protein [Planctomycetaceae bacterium]